MPVMNQELTVGLDYPGENSFDDSRPCQWPAVGPPTVHAGMLGASGSLGQCALVYVESLWTTVSYTRQPQRSTYTTCLRIEIFRDVPSPTALRQKLNM